MLLPGGFSWCEHCKIYAPEWELIAKTFKPVPTLVVGNINFPLNDIEDAKKRGIDVPGYPQDEKNKKLKVPLTR